MTVYEHTQTILNSLTPQIGYELRKKHYQMQMAQSTIDLRYIELKVLYKFLDEIKLNLKRSLKSIESI